MRLLFVADGHSPIALSWIQYFIDRGDEVFLASTYPAAIHFPERHYLHVPVAFGGAAGAARRSLGRQRARALASAGRHWLGTLTIPFVARRLRRFVERAEPDLVHAMRVPFEGMLAAAAVRKQPLAISIWGNDFTLHAVSSPLMRRRTRQAMKKATALHADCRRDVRLAEEWGLRPALPSIVVPGNGGVRTDIFNMQGGLARDPVVLNPRGSRVYVRNDTFFRAIPLILARRPEARFICASMAGDSQAGALIRQLSIGHAVELLDPVPQSEMAAIYRRAQVLVSPSTHDGTPNTLLEGMACGCFPVAGDLESVREWITHGHNGLLIDPTSPESLAEAVLIALDREDLRREAAGLNSSLVSTRAEFSQCMARVCEFYQGVARS